MTNSNNTPPRDRWPTPEPVQSWSPDEFLEALQEDQDDRRREQTLSTSPEPEPADTDDR